MKQLRLGNFDKIISTLQTAKDMHGTTNTITVTVRDTGEKLNENPRYYGAIHEQGRGAGSIYGRDYRFLSPALEDFANDVRKEYKAGIMKGLTFKIKGHRRTQKQLLDNAEMIGRNGADRVLEYVLYDAPQYPDRARKNPTLLDTGKLLDNIIYVISDKNGNVKRIGGA